MKTCLENIRNAAALRIQLKSHQDEAKMREDALRQQIISLQKEIELDVVSIDAEKVKKAREVIFVRGMYDSAGSERAGVVSDAVHQIATGEKRGYLGLDREYFGTKSYAGCHGQRCDNGFGTGPRHGSIIFQVGLTDDVRKCGGIASLTDEQREAAVYMLTRLSAVQAAEQKVAA